MSRERITTRNRTAADSSFGQSANDYWRNRAKEAVMGALSEVERELIQKAQEVTNEEATELGIQPAQYAGNVTTESPVEETSEVEESEVEEANEDEASEIAEESNEEESDEAEEDKETEEEVRMAMVFKPRSKKASEEKVFEPRQREAGALTDPSTIGKDNWFQVQEKFPQYCKQQKLTMLAVAPTKRNVEAVEAVTDSLDGIASQLEESGNVELATQLDVISDLLTASVQECKRIASASK